MNISGAGGGGKQSVICRLRYTCQNYAWGHLGEDSVVARLGLASGNIQEAKPDTPYAELWLGTHLNGPSFVGQAKARSLREQILDKLPDGLPFLLKVLSVRNVLSIQAHPNKTTAQRLFHSQPDIYKDPNHKPEMAIALTPFTAMCGFRHPNEVAELVQKVPSLQSILGEKLYTRLLGLNEEPHLSQCTFKECFGRFTSAPVEVIRAAVALHREQCTLLSKSTLDLLFLNISALYPTDFGCFAIYLLNVFQLKPGEAIFLKANTPHAYIEGDCIECMANSDNVIRLGLTHKFKDVDTALTIVNFEPTYLNDFLVPSKSFVDYFPSCTLTRYSPAVDEFAVLRIKINTTEPQIAAEKKFLHSKSSNEIKKPFSLEANSILLAVEGGATLWLQTNSGDSEEISISMGAAFFLEERCDVVSIESGKGADIYVAYIP